MIKVIRLFSKALSSVFVALVVLLAVFLGGIRLIGFEPYTVLSGSMEPSYHVGSVIYVTKAEADELEVGDTITYRLQSGTVVTHRIVEVLDNDGATPSFKTKGDANDVVDGTPVPYSAIIGKAAFSIPYLGYVSDMVQKPIGLIIILGSCVAVFMISFIIDVILPKEDKKADGTETEDKEETKGNVETKPSETDEQQN